MSAIFTVPFIAQDGLGRLPRPQATIEDAQFLDYYSLKAQKLTLSDILSHCSLNRYHNHYA